MNRLLIILSAWMAGLVPALGQSSNAATTAIQFRTAEIFVDSGSATLAAYQLEFSTKTGNVRIVGIEGGAHSAFAEPPHFDPKAIQRDRVILAAFNASPADQLPTGRTRVATIHLQVTGVEPVEFQIKLTAAATAGGGRISATAVIGEDESQ